MIKNSSEKAKGMDGTIRSVIFHALEILKALVLLRFSVDMPMSDAQTSDVIRLGVILPFSDDYMFGLRRVRPAVDIAVETVNNQSRLGNGTLEVVFRDSQCSEAHGPLAAVDMYYLKEADAFLGPVCFYAARSVIQYALDWNMTVLTPGAETTLLSSKIDPFTRVGQNHQKVINVLGALFNKYNWYTTAIIMKQRKVNISRLTYGSPCYFLGFSAKIYFMGRAAAHKKPGHQFHHHTYDEDNEDEPLNYTKIVRDVFTSARVILMCVSPDTVREIMIAAVELKLNLSEYVVLYIDLAGSPERVERPWFREHDTAERNAMARRAYESLMTVVRHRPDEAKHAAFSRQVKERAQKVDGKPYPDDQVNTYAAEFHDAVILYALTAKEFLDEGLNVRGNKNFTKRMWNRSFDGITDRVTIDANGDREHNYSLLDLNPDTEKFEVVLDYYWDRKMLEPVEGKMIHWGGNASSAPLDTPECGFDGLGCPHPEEDDDSERSQQSKMISIVVLTCLIFIIPTATLYGYKVYMERVKLSVWWKVDWEEIQIGTNEQRPEGLRVVVPPTRPSRGTWVFGMMRRVTGKFAHVNPLASSDSSGAPTPKRMSLESDLYDEVKKQSFTTKGYYKGTWVAIKKIPHNSARVTIPLLFELNKMKNLYHVHIARFVGLCFEAPEPCILTEYCQKGSLQDVLGNSSIKMDIMFKFSLMQDIVRGMKYLHQSDLKVHGNLKSSNCLLDSRFVLKLTDFGLQELRHPHRADTFTGLNTTQPIDYKGLLWTAPELLRSQHVPARGTQKGDVYSFAIICQEILYRHGVFYIENEKPTPEEIYMNVTKGEPPYFRPTLEVQSVHGSDCGWGEIEDMIRWCWAEEPKKRPDFLALKATISKINKEGDSGDILDNLLARLELYAHNLEALAEERTDSYVQEKKHVEDLLYSMLPKPVAIQLMKREPVKSEKFDNVSILFMDICGFTALSSQSTPIQIVTLLNELYSAFDRIIDSHDCYKVETIGDAYMVVSGMPIRNGTQHAREVAAISLRLLDVIKNFVMPHRPTEQFRMRLGLHSGPCVAGVVGLKTPKYCIFGDTVILAMGMESTSEPLKIHCSPTTKELLDEFDAFIVQSRGPMTVAGKEMTTYWLLEEIFVGSEESSEHTLMRTPTGNRSVLSSSAVSFSPRLVSHNPSSLTC